ncbi:beta-lactamase family protein [bacterium]|nr:beta-lactamase family protein [bacterium]MCI0602600.1 beta-lactamase family protein [bacterium]
MFRILVLLLLLSVQLQAADSITVRPGLGADLDEYLSKLQAFGFSGSVLVAKSGIVQLKKGYGLADRELGKVVTTDTLFEIASISKQFTAAAVLKLEMSGKLKTQDAVRRFFPDALEVWDRITIHNLLTHTGRIEDDYEYYANHPVLKRNEYTAAILSRPLLEKEEMIYSNDGYALLAAIIEIASGRKFEEFVTEELFHPAGMKYTSFVTRPEKLSAPLAKGYGGTLTIYGESFAELGNSGVLSNPCDLFLWERALESGEILSDEAKQKFFSPHVKTDLFDYGYGWWVEDNKEDGRIIWHSGHGNSFNGFYRRYIDRGLVVIGLTNLAIADFPVREALMPAVRPSIFKFILSGKPYKLPPDISVHKRVNLKNYEGTYSFDDNGTVRISVVGDSLMVAPQDQRAVNRFVPGIPDNWDASFYSKLELPVPGSKDLLSLLEKNTKKCEKILSELFQGKLDHLAELLGKEGMARFKPEWEEAQKRFGKMERYKVLGTVPIFQSKKSLYAETYSILNFANGTKYYRWVWGPSESLMWFPDFPLPMVPPFRPQSTNKFVNFHLFIQGSTNLEFELKDGRSMGLALRDREGQIVARARRLQKE